MISRLRSLPVVSVAVAVQKRYGADSGGYLAAVLTYYGFLSFFPLVLLGLSIVGFALSEADFQTQLEWTQRLTSAVPGLGSLVVDALGTVVRRRHATGATALLGLLWSGMAAAKAAGHALGCVFRREDVRGLVRSNVWALGTTVLVGALAGSGAVVATGVGALRAGGAAGIGLRLSAGLLALLLDFALFLVAYRVLTPGGGPSFRRVWRGALLAAVGWTGLKLFGSWYAAHTVRTSTAVYGTFASVVAVLVLLYLASRLFVYGAELAAVLDERDCEGGSAVADSHVGRDGHVASDGQVGRGRHVRRDESASRPARDENRLRSGREAVPADGQSTPELVASIAGDVGALVRSEVALARQEIVEAVMVRIKSAAALSAAGVTALLAVVFAALAAADALAAVLPAWAARLVVAGAFALAAGLAVVFGVLRVRTPPLTMDDTVRTVKEDVEWAKGQLRR